MSKTPALKKKELEKFKDLLVDERKKVTLRLEEISDESGKDLDLTTGDSVDIASLEINQSQLQKLGKRELYLLKKIDLALHKIEEGTYGECESCGEQINPARLVARPVAQLCIDCKTQQENEEKKFSSREREEDGMDDTLGDESEDL